MHHYFRGFGLGAEIHYFSDVFIIMNEHKLKWKF